MATASDELTQAIAMSESSVSKYFPANRFSARSDKDPAATPPANLRASPPPSGALAYAMRTISNADGSTLHVVQFMGDHQVLDLSSLMERTSIARIPAISGFDLGGHHNALKLSINDVLTLGETDLFIDDGKLQLSVRGTEDDSVDIFNSHVAGLSDGEWHHHGTAHMDGVTYNVIEHSSTNAELLIENAIEIHMR